MTLVNCYLYFLDRYRGNPGGSRSRKDLRGKPGGSHRLFDELRDDFGRGYEFGMRADRIEIRFLRD